MSAKTKIVVFHKKELIYTGIFVALGILFLIMMIIMFLPDKPDTPKEHDTTPVSAGAVGSYIPGIYTTELVLGNESVDVEVIVSQEAISSIRLNNVNENISTMYPLLAPALEKICDQVYETQSLENITYEPSSKYTSLVLLEAIRNSLDKASVKAQN